MQYNFKVGDKVKMSEEGVKYGICTSVKADDVMLIVGCTDWAGKPAYNLEYSGQSKGVFTQSEIELVKPKKEPKVIEITKWALVNKYAPVLIDHELFYTRTDARAAKKMDVLGASLKVVKVKIQYEV
jgi:hypothetical protein